MNRNKQVAIVCLDFQKVRVPQQRLSKTSPLVDWALAKKQEAVRKKIDQFLEWRDVSRFVLGLGLLNLFIHDLELGILLCENSSVPARWNWHICIIGSPFNVSWGSKRETDHNPVGSLTIRYLNTQDLDIYCFSVCICMIVYILVLIFHLRLM